MQTNQFNQRYLTDSDERAMTVYEYKDKLVPPVVGIFDEPRRCYPLNNEWSKIVIGALQMLLDFGNWKDATDDSYIAIQQVLDFMTGSECFDCDDVNDCLPSASNFISVQSTATEANDRSTTNSGRLDDAEDAINNIYLGNPPPDNSLPPLPDPVTEPDRLCNAAYYIAVQLQAFIDETFQDASTITLAEFLTGLFGLGGFDGSLAKALWDYMVANSNETIPADTLAAISEVHEYLYCNNLDMDAVKADIQASGTMTVQAINSYVAAIDAITDAKISLWAFVGAETENADCSAFCPSGWTHTFDFTVSTGGWTPQIVGGNPCAVYAGQWDSVDNPNTNGRRVGIERSFALTTITQIEVVYTRTKGTFALADQNSAAIIPGLTYEENEDPLPATLQWSGSQEIANLIVFVRSSIGDPPIYDGACAIQQITISGTGTNPF